DRMIKAYGNHPSFMLLSASNEPKGKWKESLSKWVEHYRKEDPRRLYTSGTGHTDREIPNITEGTDYLAIQRIGPKLLRRESGWFGGDYRDALEDVNIPVISHEVGQWAAYPDFDIIKKFKGYMRPGNFEIFRDSLKARGLLEKNKGFVHASGRFQLAAYKEEIEANLRTPGLSGFQLLDLHDYVGQGTALVGLLDAFWEPKGYATAEEFKQFCHTTVPLARLQRVFTTAQQLNAEVEVAHFGAAPIEDAKGVWRIELGKDDIVGEWDTKTIPLGKNIPLGNMSVALSKLAAPAEYKLVVTVAPESFFTAVSREIIPRPDIKRGVNYFQNEWNFWVYPAEMPQWQFFPQCPESRVKDILVTSSWDEAEAKLASGGKVLFSPRNVDLNWTSPPLDMVPIFWNRLMGPGWSRMLGLWIDLKPGEAKNIMLSKFPTSTSFDWQWAQIIGGVRAINMDQLPSELEPVVWAIDDWNRNHKLGVLFEGGVGNGRLLVSAFDVTKPNSANPVLRQLRDSLLYYMSTDCFQPNIGVTTEEIRSLLFDTRIMAKLGATAHVGGEPANRAIDGDPNTFVLVGDRQAPTRDNVELVIDFSKPVAMAGLVLMPRQNHREHEGDIREYSVQISDDGRVWSDIARGELVSTFAPHRIEFARSYTAKHLKFIAFSGFGTDKTTSLSELAVIYAGPKLESGSVIEYQRNRSATPEIDEGPEKKPTPSPSPRPKPKHR
ncbi:MAG TPA: discoidin domain-containing protein, partial [Pyrinomonadaceae bacterium]